MTYSEKLKDPRWQKKRLSILNRDSFTCQHCGSKENTLHVHHLVYLKSTDPWEYKDEYLLTLCFECHKQEEVLKERVNKIIEGIILSCNTICPVHNLLSGYVNDLKPVVTEEIFEPELNTLFGDLNPQTETKALKTLQEIREMVALEEKNRNHDQKELNEKELQIFWEFEINRLYNDGKNTAVYFFKSAKLSIVNNHIEIITDSAIQQKIIEAERSELTWSLRSYFNNKLLGHRVIMIEAKN
jgi:hypothetical protein